MDLLELIKTRRSIRKYLKKEVEREKLLKILEAAIWAPNSGNTQTWRFFVVSNDRVKLSLYRASFYQHHVIEAPIVIVVCFDMREMYSYYGDRGITLYAIQDTAAAIQNMLLMAHYLGLGSCWIGAFDEDLVKKALKLPEYLRVVALITLGYPNEKPISWRKDLKEVVRFIE